MQRVTATINGISLELEIEEGTELAIGIKDGKITVRSVDKPFVIYQTQPQYVPAPFWPLQPLTWPTVTCGDDVSQNRPMITWKAPAVIAG